MTRAVDVAPAGLPARVVLIAMRIPQNTTNTIACMPIDCVFAFAWTADRFALPWLFLEHFIILWLVISMEQGGSTDLGSSGTGCIAATASAGDIQRKRVVVRG